MDDVVCKLATGGDDIKLWDCTTSTPQHQFSPHSQAISSLCWSQNNQILVSASSGGDKIVLTYVKNLTTNVINLAEGERQTCLALHSTSRYLVSGGKNQLVSIWDIKNRKLKKTYHNHTSAVTCVTLNRNDTYIASGAANGDILLHNVVSGQACTPLVTPKVQTVRGLEYSHFKKSLLASVSDDGTLNLWDTNTHKVIHSFKDAHKASATALSFSPVNEMLLTSVGLDKKIVCFDVMGKSAIRTITVESPLTSIAFMHDGATVAAGSTRGKVYMFDLRMGSSPLNTLNAHKTSVQCVAFQHSAFPRTNGVSGLPSSTIPATGQRNQGQRKVVQSMPGSLAITPINGRAQADVPKDAINNADANIAIINRVSPPTKDNDAAEMVGIISPMREGIGAMSINNTSTSPPELLGRPEAVGKADTQLNDSFVTIFSPLASNTNDSAERKTPIGSVSINPAMLVNHQPTTNNVPYERGTTSGSSLTNALTRTPTPTPASSHPTSLNYATSVSPVRDYTTNHSRGCAITPEEPVRLKSNTPSTPATSQQYGVPPETTALSVDTSPVFSSPGRRSTGAPATGLLGGSADHAKSPDPTLLAAAYTAHPYPGPGPAPVGVAVGGTPFQAFQVEFMKNLIDDSLERFRESIHVEMRNMQREMVRQFQIQQNEMQGMLERYSVNEGLLSELERLREENKQLKNKY